MTKLNDYLWHLPHTPLPDDPPDVAALQQAFNQPIAGALQRPLGEMGYRLQSSDVIVRLDDRFDRTADTYYANVRFVDYLEPDVFMRVQFEHAEWALILPGCEQHTYFINLDRFKVQDPATQVAVPAWPGRLHSRMSNLPGDALHHDGQDQIWSFTSAGEFEAQLQLFLDKFARLGRPWLEDRGTL
jgi:hypothetical protein